MVESHGLGESLCPVTLVVSEVVKPGQIEAYEAWARGINRAASEFEGYLGIDVIRPRDHAYPEYVTIVKFDNYVHYRVWLDSETCQQWLAELPDLVLGRSLQSQPSGLELWFTLPQRGGYQPPQPAYYKQVLLGTLTVYPLIGLINLVLGPWIQWLPPQPRLLVSVFFLSALLTYPVMPWVNRLFAFWLHSPRRDPGSESGKVTRQGRR